LIRLLPVDLMYCIEVLLVTWAFDIHKIRVGTLYETLLLVSSLLLLWRWVQQVLRELKVMRCVKSPLPTAVENLSYDRFILNS